MYSVFSEKLMEHVNLIEWAKAKSARVSTVPKKFETINEAFDQLIKEGKKLYIPHILIDLRSYQEDAICDESYKICICPGLQNIIKWTCREILLNLLKDSYKTRNVKLRIATGMLNNLERDGIIDHYLNIYYHDAFLLNIYTLTTDLVKEELPF